MQSYIMALDAGTTSNRCLIFDRAGRIVSFDQQEFPQYYPKPGWVEQDAEELWQSQVAVIRNALMRGGIAAAQIEAIGITNQRETTLVWERTSGKALAPAIVWQCRRTAPICDRLKSEGLTPLIREKTGLIPDAYFSATKLQWLLDTIPGARDRAARGELLFGTVDSYLIWRLTGGRVHMTDCSNAARTMLFNIHTLQWDADLLKLFDIPHAMLPEVRPSSALYGKTDAALLGREIPICGAAGDQQAALFGQTCFSPGEAKNTDGTGCFLLMNTGEVPIRSENGLLTTVAWGLNGRVQYALEGSVFVAGAAIQWLRDELGLIRSAAETEQIALSVPDTNGCYVVPAFVGLGAPYWDSYARGAILGLTRGVNRHHLVRATLESLAYQTHDVLNAMQTDANLRLAALRADGGASANRFLMQFQADIIAAPVVCPAVKETTALGAAYLAGLAVGYWESLDELKHQSNHAETYHPSMSEDARSLRLSGWKKAVTRTLTNV